MRFRKPKSQRRRSRGKKSFDCLKLYFLSLETKTFHITIAGWHTQRVPNAQSYGKDIIQTLVHVEDKISKPRHKAPWGTRLGSDRFLPDSENESEDKRIGKGSQSEGMGMLKGSRDLTVMYWKLGSGNIPEEGVVSENDRDWVQLGIMDYIDDEDEDSSGSRSGIWCHSTFRRFDLEISSRQEI